MSGFYARVRIAIIKYNFMSKNKLIAIFIFALFALVLVSGCIKKQPEPAVNNTEPVATTTEEEKPPEEVIKYLENGEINTSDWQIYRNEDLGLAFSYPINYLIKEETDLAGFDTGKRRDIYVRSKNGQNILSISVTSKDYSEGVSEGCCFYYSGNSLDIETNLDIIVELISDLEPINIEQIKIGDQEGVQFFSLKSYDSMWIVDSILIPYNRNEFTNLLISGPTLYTSESVTGSKQESEVLKSELIKKVDNNEYSKNIEVVNNYNLYKQIIKTIKFTN